LELEDVTLPLLKEYSAKHTERLKSSN